MIRTIRTVALYGFRFQGQSSSDSVQTSYPLRGFGTSPSRDMETALPMEIDASVLEHLALSFAPFPCTSNFSHNFYPAQHLKNFQEQPNLNRFPHGVIPKPGRFPCSGSSSSNLWITFLHRSSWSDLARGQTQLKDAKCKDRMDIIDIIGAWEEHERHRTSRSNA
jgi:hypothetical protein